VTSQQRTLIGGRRARHVARRGRAAAGSWEHRTRASLPDQVPENGLREPQLWLWPSCEQHTANRVGGRGEGEAGQGTQNTRVVGSAHACARGQMLGSLRIIRTKACPSEQRLSSLRQRETGGRTSERLAPREGRPLLTTPRFSLAF
jgi:hypothetical protein